MRRCATAGISWFLALLVAGYAVGRALTAWMPIGPGSWERSVVRWFVDHRSAGLTDLVQALQWIGTSTTLIAFTAVAAVAVVFGGGRRAWFGVWLGLGAETFVDVLKPWIDRPRPPVRWRLEDTPSGAFPSGHALTTMTIVLGLVVVLWRGRGRRTPRWAWVVAGAVGVALGLMRVYLGVHWITDVAGGQLMAVGWVLLLAAVMFDSPGRSGAGVTEPAAVEQGTGESG